MANQAKIRALLAQAQAALTGGEWEKAAKLYTKASDEAGPIDLDLFDQALDGLQAVKQQQARQTSSQPLLPPNGRDEASKPSSPLQIPRITRRLLDLQDRAQTAETPSAPPRQRASLDPSQSLQQRIQILETEAASYLRQPTNANFKAARDLFERILNYSILTPEQRRFYELRRAKVEQERVTLIARFGVLLTARQIASDTDELLEVCKLLASGITVDIEGKSLDERFLELRDSLIAKLVRSADERIAVAEEALAEGLNYLEEQQFVLAQNIFQEAIQIVEGQALEPLLLPNDKEAQATDNALRYLKRHLKDHKQTQKTLNDYRQRQSRIIKLQKLVGRLRPSFEQATVAYQAGDYRTAVLQTEDVAGQLGPGLASEAVNTLLQLSRQRWEREALVRLTTLLEQARLDLSRQHEAEALTLLSQILQFEPALITPAIAEKQREAYQLQQNLREAIEERHKFDLRILSKVRQGIKQAQRLLTMGAGEELLTAKNALEEYHTALTELSDQEDQQKYSRILYDLAEKLESQGRKQRERERIQIEIRRLLENATLALRNEDYQAAQTKVAQATDLLAPEELDLQQRCTDLKQKIQIQQIDDLRNQVIRLMSADIPEPKATLTYLAQLRTLPGGLDDNLLLLEKRARELLAQQEGLTAFKQGRYAEAVKLLAQANPAASGVAAALLEARQRLATHLINSRIWAAALNLLEQVDLADSLSGFLLQRAYLGQALEQTSMARRQCRFQEAKKLLLNAETHLERAIQQLPFLSELTQADLPERELLASESQTLMLEWTRYQEAQELQEHAAIAYAAYQQKSNPLDLQTALRTLEQALALWPASDEQRLPFERLRREYSQQYEQVMRETCREIIERGKKQQEKLDFAGALASFREAESLRIGSLQNEIQIIIERLRTVIKDKRADLIAEAQQLLQSRRVTTQRITNLLQRLQKLRLWDEQNDDGLSKIEYELKDANLFIAQIEHELAIVRSQWLVARQRGTDFKAARLALQRTLSLFNQPNNARPFLHELLDQGSNLSLIQRLDDDERNLQEANSLHKELLQLVEQTSTLKQAGAWATFERLQRAEERLLQETERLLQEAAPEPGTTTSQERYPRQYEILLTCVKRINGLVQTLHEETDSKIAETSLNTYYELLNWFEKVNKKDPFRLSPEIQAL